MTDTFWLFMECAWRLRPAPTKSLGTLEKSLRGASSDARDPQREAFVCNNDDPDGDHDRNDRPADGSGRRVSRGDRMAS